MVSNLSLQNRGQFLKRKAITFFPLTFLGILIKINTTKSEKEKGQARGVKKFVGNYGTKIFRCTRRKKLTQ
jgi:hypothetical protein